MRPSALFFSSRLLCACLSALAIAMPALAIEAPPDDAPPPADPAATPDAVQVPAARPAYLGVVAVAVPEMLAEHLGLAQDAGVLVQAVCPDSPSAKAGVAVHDLITRIDDVAVASSADLTREVAKRQPGQQVRLGLIHKGKPANLDVTLEARPADLAAAAPQLPNDLQLEQLQLDGIPEELAERIRRMVEGNLGEMKLEFERGLDQAAPQIEDAMREARQRMQDALKQQLQLPEIPAIPRGGIEIHQGATFRLMDGEGSIEMKASDGGKEVTVRDQDDQILWTGPWDTEQDKAAAPEDIRQRIERLNFDNQGNGLRFQFHGGGAPEPK